MIHGDTPQAVVPGYYLVCYNIKNGGNHFFLAVVPGYYLVCYNFGFCKATSMHAVVPGYYLVCYNSAEKHNTFHPL